MKRIKWLILALIIQLYFPTGVIAVDKEKKEGPSGFFLTENRKHDRIPFKFRSNLIIVPIQINGSDTLNFILDTGVAHTIILDPTTLDKSKLDLKRRLMIGGMGEGKMISAHTAIGNSLSMQHMQVNQHNMLILDEPLTMLSAYAGMPVHGIIGYEIFDSFVVTLDFDRKELTLTTPSKYQYNAKKGDKLPILIHNTKPYLGADTRISGKDYNGLRYMIDTGAGNALLIDHSSKKEIPMPTPVIQSREGLGLNGAVKGSMGRIDGIKLGTYDLKNVLASFPDSLAFGLKMADRDDRQGSIGCELLRRFKVTFNYRRHYMVIKPVKSRLKERFEYNMSGLDILAAGENLDTYFIDHVNENSPGAKAGLKKGDQILYIDGTSVKDMNISEVYQLMKKGNGKSLDVMVIRDKKSFFAMLKLQRII
ncbi:aspartyl protease family protein [Dyadobacter sp. LHD-138]|uniref:aspartyl protease family protein n=1 Tax=Dyadobacter sp. LHD-138 TaxID=3071413 RepID=UPI0027E0622A|nr:aspartyl protease family protein [Dyadobacter sp. LHD-138]MDQ6480117.1 aspartyl protease family protein [Dyadobacter sp. LHD-138]